MTAEEKRLLIEKTMYRKAKTYEPSDHLHLVLVLIVYSMMDPISVYRMKYSDIKKIDEMDGVFYVYPVNQRTGIAKYCPFNEETFEEIKAYMEKYEVGPDDPLLQVGERQLRGLFKKVATENGFPNIQLKDMAKPCTKTE